MLALLALAFLAACAAATALPSPPSGDPYQHAHREPAPIALTVAEIRHLFTTLVIQPIPDITHYLHWSLPAPSRRPSQPPQTPTRYRTCQVDHELRLP